MRGSNQIMLSFVRTLKFLRNCNCGEVLVLESFLLFLYNKPLLFPLYSPCILPYRPTLCLLKHLQFN